MGNKIFVSYKYADDKVENLTLYGESTVRDYVDEFERKLDLSDNIYKGESEGEDLSDLSDDTIWKKLKGRIYDCSVTVIFISPGMRDWEKKDRDQWIPWEVSYSLKETSRRNKNGVSIKSHSNAMVAVVLPDSTGSYSYYLESKSCCSGGCTMHHTNRLFAIIKKNKFNRVKHASNRKCDNKNTIWTGTCSYIEAVKWSSFIKDYQKNIEKAIERKDNIDEYDICKEVYIQWHKSFLFVLMNILQMVQLMIIAQRLEAHIYDLSGVTQNILYISYEKSGAEGARLIEHIRKESGLEENFEIQMLLGDRYGNYGEFNKAIKVYEELWEKNGHKDLSIQDAIACTKFLMDNQRNDNGINANEMFKKMLKFKINNTVVRTTPKTSRNNPCPCGSGLKYKKCCGKQYWVQTQMIEFVKNESQMKADLLKRSAINA